MPFDEDAVHAADDKRAIDYRRSLRASLERRKIARRERRVFRGKGAAMAAGGLLAVVSGGAFAQQHVTASRAPAVRISVIVAAQRALGVVPDGIVGPVTRGAARRFQSAHGLVADGVIGPRTLAALGIHTRAAGLTRASVASLGGGVASTLARIASCESNGDPRAVSATGVYRGKYQFSRVTWRAVGGTGDPADAPEVVQDRMAAALLARAGTRAWPRCA